MRLRRRPWPWVCSGNPSWLGGWEGIHVASSDVVRAVKVIKVIIVIIHKINPSIPCQHSGKLK